MPTALWAVSFDSPKSRMRWVYIRTARARVSSSYLRGAGTVSVSLRDQSLCRIQDGSQPNEPPPCPAGCTSTPITAPTPSWWPPADQPHRCLQPCWALHLADAAIIRRAEFAADDVVDDIRTDFLQVRAHLAAARGAAGQGHAHPSRRRRRAARADRRPPRPVHRGLRHPEPLAADVEHRQRLAV